LIEGGPQKGADGERNRAGAKGPGRGTEKAPASFRFICDQLIAKRS
jgi:hypothetical protein